MGKVQSRNADHACDESRYARHVEDSRVEEELYCYDRITITGAATVILAMGAGKKAARAIHAHLSGK
jgi:NADPH-dependent glutamate synthase beta subunit-like oxidoreductase